MNGSLVSVRPIDFGKFFMSFASSQRDEEITSRALQEEGKRALAEGAHVVILGCTAFPSPKSMEKELGIPIVNSSAMLKMAEILVDLSIGNKKPRKRSFSEDVTGVGEKIKVKLIVPSAIAVQKLQLLKKYADLIVGNDAKVTILVAGKNVGSTRSVYDDVGAYRFILKEAADAARERFDSVVIGSFQDSCLESAREVCSIPVVGLCESSMLLAALLSDRFAVLTLSDISHQATRRMVRSLGLENKLQSLEVVDTDTNLDHILKDVEVAVVGELDSRRLAQKIRTTNDKVIVLEPLGVALKMSIALHSLHLSQSRLSYPKPVLPMHHKIRLKKARKLIPKYCSFLYDPVN
jgi:Asp/Glu/hydantoin racemase